MSENEAPHGDGCAVGCCDPTNQPSYFNKYTLTGAALLGGLIAVAALVQAFSG